eukprot:5560400-Prymnesium_polylepis.2
MHPHAHALSADCRGGGRGQSFQRLQALSAAGLGTFRGEARRHQRRRERSQAWHGAEWWNPAAGARATGVSKGCFRVVGRSAQPKVGSDAPGGGRSTNIL